MRENGNRKQDSLNTRDASRGRTGEGTVVWGAALREGAAPPSATRPGPSALRPSGLLGRLAAADPGGSSRGARSCAFLFFCSRVSDIFGNLKPGRDGTA